MTTQYLTYMEIPIGIRNIKGFASPIPLDAAGNPYTIYEYDPELPECDQYFGLSPRKIREIMNGEAQ